MQNRSESPETSSIRHRTVVGAGWMIGLRMGSRLLGLASTLALARLLSPADFGIVAMAATVAGITDSLTEMGVSDGLVRYKGDAKPLYDTAFTMQFMRGLVSALLVVAAAPLAAYWFNEPRLTPVLWLVAALYAMAGLENIGVVEFRRSIRFDQEFLLAVVPRVCQFCVTVTLAFLLHSYWAMIAGLATIKLVRLGATYWMHPHRPRLSLYGWRELAGFSFWMWMQALAFMVWNRADAAIIGPALGSAQLGTILVAIDLAALPTSEILGPATTVMFAGMAAARNQGIDTISGAFRVAFSLLMLVAPLAIGISATSGFMVAGLLGANWTEAQQLVAIYALSGLLAPFSFVCTNVLTANGKVRQNFCIVAASSVVKIALIGLASTTRDVAAVAGASVVISVIEAGIFVAVLRREGARVRGMQGPMLRLALAGLASAGAMLLTGVAWQATNLAAVPALLLGGAVGLLGIAVYGTVLLGSWWLAGRPAGPEADIAGTLTRMIPGGRLRRAAARWLPG